MMYQHMQTKLRMYWAYTYHFHPGMGMPTQPIPRNIWNSINQGAMRCAFLEFCLKNLFTDSDVILSFVPVDFY